MENQLVRTIPDNNQPQGFTDNYLFKNKDKRNGVWNNIPIIFEALHG